MKAYGYCRYSTDRQTDNSIAYQKAEIEKYCKTHHIPLSGFFSDEGETGTNMDRAGFHALMQAVIDGNCDTIIIYDISRGSRDVADWFNFRKQMARLNVKIISATQPLGDITNPSDFLTELISVGLGQHAVLDTRKKSIDGVAVRAKEGAFLGGIPPLGYDIINGQYHINEHEAQAVRTIFDMYARGKSYNQIIDALGGMRGKRGQLLGKNSLSSVLRNERYIGIYTWNKRKMKLFRKWAGGKPNPDCVRIEGAIPPIIDLDIWERVQKRMSEHQRRASNKAKRTYLLSGLIECSACGATYVGHTSTNTKGYESRYYVCGNKYRTRSCQAKNINADEIETFVVQNLKAYLLETDFVEVAQRIANQINSASPELTAEKAELANITMQINNGMKAILKGMEFPELAEEITRLRMRKSELKDIIGRSERNRNPVDPEKIVALFRYATDHFDDAHLPEIVKAHVTKIYADPDGSYTVNIGVHINGCGGWI